MLTGEGTCETIKKWQREIETDLGFFLTVEKKRCEFHLMDNMITCMFGLQQSDEEAMGSKPTHQSVPGSSDPVLSALLIAPDAARTHPGSRMTCTAGYRQRPWDGPRQPQSDMCGQHVAQISLERHAAGRVVTIYTHRAVRNTQPRLRSLARAAVTLTGCTHVGGAVNLKILDSAWWATIRSPACAVPVQNLYTGKWSIAL